MHACTLFIILQGSLDEDKCDEVCTGNGIYPVSIYQIALHNESSVGGGWME